MNTIQKCFSSVVKHLFAASCALALLAPAAAVAAPALSGSGTEASPYLITSSADMASFRDWVNAGNNCAGEYFSQTADIAITAWSGIGTSESASFQGVYDGGNKTISAQFDSGKYRGVFAYAKNATIKNLKVNVTGRTGIATETGGAAFVGQSYGSTLQNLTATCDAGAMGTAEAPLTHNGGGIVVRMNGGTCYACTNKMDIHTSYTKVGGIAAFGQSSNTDYFELCSNEGALHRSYTGTGDGGCAGIIGWQGYSDFQPVSIKDCSSTGAIVASKTLDTGSFIGYKSEGGLTVSGINVGLADLRPVGMGGHNTPLLWFATVNTSVTPDTATFNGYALNASNKVMEANSAAITLANEGDYIILDTSLAAYSGTVSRSDAGAVTTTVLSGTVTRYEWALPTFTVNVAAGAGVENLQYKLGAAGEWTAYTAALANVAKGTVLVVKGTTSAAGYEVKDATVTVVADYPSETPLTINKSLIQYFPTAGTTGAYPGQDGSASNPFVLATADDYVALKNAVANGTAGTYCYRQVADITLGSAETPWAGIGLNHVQNGWNETGTYGFSGTLDGGNYTVNVYMGGGRYHGLFNNAVDAAISNLTVNVTGWAASDVADDGGALCGVCTRSTLQNIKTTASGTISTDGNLGGVAGVARASTLIACTNEIDLTTTFWHVGGIVSYTDGLVATTIRNCMNEGALTSDRPSGYVGGGNPVSIGGILGWANGAATIDSCVNTGTLTTGANWGVPASTKFGYGSILGTWDQRVTTVTGVNVGQDNVAGCLHDVATLQWALPDTPSAGLVTFCTPETAVAGTVAYKAMYSNAKAFTLTAPNASLTIITNFAAYTGMVSLDASLLADDYELVIGGDADKVVYTAAIPTPALTGNGTEASPYLITSLADLVTFRDWVNATNDCAGECFQLTADIDMTGVNWTPIGDDGTYDDYLVDFGGTFNGGGHRISNLVIEDHAWGAALFGLVSGMIENLTIADSHVTGSSGGYALFVVIGTGDFTMRNCHAINSYVTAGTSSGLMVSYVDAAGTVALTNCDTDVDCHATEASGYQIGGIVGQVCYTDSITFSGCTNNADLSGTGAIGGIVGQLGAATKTALFTGCANTGSITVTGGAKYAGGFVGYKNMGGGVTGLSMTFTDCYNAGTVLGGEAGAQLGGFVGFSNGTDASFTRCVNSGAIGDATYAAARAAGFIAIDNSTTDAIRFEDCVNSGGMTGTSIGAFGGTLPTTITLGGSATVNNALTTLFTGKDNATYADAYIAGDTTTTYFADFTDALAAAASGDTITLLANDLTAELAAGQSVTIDANGHSGLSITTVAGYEVVYADGTYSSVQLPVLVAQIGTTKYASINAAFAAVNGQAGESVEIKILADVTEELTDDYIFNKGVTLATDVEGGVTVNLGFEFGRDLWAIAQDGPGKLVIEDDVTITNLGQLFAGLGTAGGVVDIEGDVTAQQLWAYLGGVVNIKPTAKVVTGYGDGMVKLRYNSTINVTGNGQDEVQFAAGYFSADYSGAMALNLTNTYVTSAWLIKDAASGSFTLNLDNAKLVLNGDLDLGANATGTITMTIDSIIIANSISNVDVINIDATGLANSVKVIDYTGSGTMTLDQYGTVNVPGGEAYVENNDLWVRAVDPLAPASVIVPEGGADTVDVTIPNTNGLCFVRFYNGFGDRGYVTYRYTGEDTFTFFTGDLAPGTYDYEVFYSGTAVPPGYKPAAEATGGQPAATVVDGVPRITINPVSGLYYTIFAGDHPGTLNAAAASVLATPANEMNLFMQIPVVAPSEANGVKFVKLYASDDPFAPGDPEPGAE